MTSASITIVNETQIMDNIGTTALTIESGSLTIGESNTGIYPLTVTISGSAGPTITVFNNYSINGGIGIDGVGTNVTNYGTLIVNGGAGGNNSEEIDYPSEAYGSSNGGIAVTSNIVNYGNLTVNGGVGGTSATTLISTSQGTSYNITSAGSASGGIGLSGTLTNYGTATVSGGNGGNNTTGGTVNITASATDTSYSIGDMGDANGGVAISNEVINSGILNVYGGKGGNSDFLSGSLYFSYSTLITITSLGNGGSANGGDAIVGAITNTSSGLINIYCGVAGNNETRSGALYFNQLSGGTIILPTTIGTGGSANGGIGINGYADPNNTKITTNEGRIFINLTPASYGLGGNLGTNAGVNTANTTYNGTATGSVGVSGRYEGQEYGLLISKGGIPGGNSNNLNKQAGVAFSGTLNVSQFSTVILVGGNALSNVTSSASGAFYGAMTNAGYIDASSGLSSTNTHGTDMTFSSASTNAGTIYLCNGGKTFSPAGATLLTNNGTIYGTTTGSTTCPTETVNAPWYQPFIYQNYLPVSALNEDITALNEEGTYQFSVSNNGVISETYTLLPGSTITAQTMNDTTPVVVFRNGSEYYGVTNPPDSTVNPTILAEGLGIYIYVDSTYGNSRTVNGITPCGSLVIPALFYTIS